MFKRILSLTVILCFFLTTLCPLPNAHADSVPGLPVPGTMVNLSPAYEPVIIKGLTVHKDNPFLFDFIVDVGQDKMSGEPLKKEGEKLIKYFLAGLAIPDKDLWVNLSPYEKNRMVPEALGQTDMGRDLLEQDYILKQITASLIYPEKKLGKSFWDKVYAKAQEMYGTTQIPVDTFNKVWIMADRAEVFEHNQTAFVVGRHLKVMLEEDYLALSRHSEGVRSTTEEPKNGLRSFATLKDEKTHSIASQIVRSIILPELEKEVNTGKNFATLRQIFNSVILSAWYKKDLKEAILNQVYAGQSKVKGINIKDPTIKDQIYEQYLKAYKKGVFNYIKEDINKAGETIPRKYFSGGTVLKFDLATISKPETGVREMMEQGHWDRDVDFATLVSPNEAMIAVNEEKPGSVLHGDAAMRAKKEEQPESPLYDKEWIKDPKWSDINTQFNHLYATTAKLRAMKAGFISEKDLLKNEEYIKVFLEDFPRDLLPVIEDAELRKKLNKLMMATVVVIFAEYMSEHYLLARTMDPELLGADEFKSNPVDPRISMAQELEYEAASDKDLLIRIQKLPIATEIRKGDLVAYNVRKRNRIILIFDGAGEGFPQEYSTGKITNPRIIARSAALSIKRENGDASPANDGIKLNDTTEFNRPDAAMILSDKFYNIFDQLTKSKPEFTASQLYYVAQNSLLGYLINLNKEYAVDPDDIAPDNQVNAAIKMLYFVLQSNNLPPKDVDIGQKKELFLILLNAIDTSRYKDKYLKNNTLIYELMQMIQYLITRDGPEKREPSIDSILTQFFYVFSSQFGSDEESPTDLKEKIEKGIKAKEKAMSDQIINTYYEYQSKRINVMADMPNLVAMFKTTVLGISKAEDLGDWARDFEKTMTNQDRVPPNTVKGAKVYAYDAVAAAALGEQTPGGHLFKGGNKLAGTIFILGTGSKAVAVDTEGTVINLDLGDPSLGEYFSGLNIARRFIRDPNAKNMIARYLGKEDVGEVFDLIKKDIPINDVLEKEVQKEGIDKLLKAISSGMAAEIKGKSRQQIGAFVKGIGQEIGQALGALFIGHINEPWVENFILVSGFGEDFAKVDKRDVLLEEIQRGLRADFMQRGAVGGRIDTIIKGVARRSTMGLEREAFATALLTDDEKADLRIGSEAYSIGYSIDRTNVGVALLDTNGETTTAVEQWAGELPTSNPNDFARGLVQLMIKLANDVFGENIELKKRVIKVSMAFAPTNLPLCQGVNLSMLFKTAWDRAMINPVDAAMSGTLNQFGSVTLEKNEKGIFLIGKHRNITVISMVDDKGTRTAQIFDREGNASNKVLEGEHVEKDGFKISVRNDGVHVTRMVIGRVSYKVLTMSTIDQVTAPGKQPRG